MVKLATARECRTYGPGLTRNRAEYMNAGIYVCSTIMLICGFVLLLLMQPKVGLVMVLIGLMLIVAVNVHDLIAHLAGIDYRVGLMELDIQLLLVEVGVPFVQALGALLFFLGILFLLIQGEKGYIHSRLEAHAMNMLIAGSVLWVLGSILNSCQIYERADGHVQILQQSVQIPFLTGSFLFMVGAILNSREDTGYSRHGLHLLVSDVEFRYERANCHKYGGLRNFKHLVVFHMTRLVEKFPSITNGLHNFTQNESYACFKSGTFQSHLLCLVSFLQRRTWVWIGMFASLLLLIGGLANVVKVFKMLQMDRLRLEKLRGGAQERLVRVREGQTPFLREERRRWPTQVETPIEPPPQSTPYKDVLVGKS